MQKIKSASKTKLCLKFRIPCLKYFTNDKETLCFTLQPNFPVGNKYGNASSSKWSLFNIETGMLPWPGGSHYYIIIINDYMDYWNKNCLESYSPMSIQWKIHWFKTFIFNNQTICCSLVNCCNIRFNFFWLFQPKEKEISSENFFLLK